MNKIGECDIFKYNLKNIVILLIENTLNNKVRNRNATDKI